MVAIGWFPFMCCGGLAFADQLARPLSARCGNARFPSTTRQPDPSDPGIDRDSVANIDGASSNDGEFEMSATTDAPASTSDRAWTVTASHRSKEPPRRHHDLVGSRPAPP